MRPVSFAHELQNAQLRIGNWESDLQQAIAAKDCASIVAICKSERELIIANASLKFKAKLVFFIMECIVQKQPDAIRAILNVMPDLIKQEPGLIACLIMADHPPYDKEFCITATNIVFGEYLLQDPDIQWPEGIKECLTLAMEMLPLVIQESDHNTLTEEERVKLTEFKAKFYGRSLQDQVSAFLTSWHQSGLEIV